MKKEKTAAKKVLAIVSLIIFILLMVFISFYVIMPLLDSFSQPEQFRDYINSYGIWSRLIFLGIQFLQVFIALIPGEIVEIGAGYTFGWFEGTLLCIAGTTIASGIIFLLVKKLGMRMVELFVDKEKIDNMKFLQQSQKLNNIVFIVFLIPGTPKDLLTYVVAMTKMKLTTFLAITSIARLPSVVSSTVGGSFIQKQDYLTAGIIFAVTLIVSAVGYFIYNRIVKKHNQKKQKEEIN